MFWYNIQDNTIDLRANLQYIKVLEAAEVTIQDIMNRFPAPYYLMVSGGIDSQAVMYMWKQFGKNYIPTSVRYIGNFNDEDLSTLPAFCKNNNIEIEYKDFDILKFYETYDQFADKYKCVSPHFGTHLGMTEDLPGTVIFSGDFIQDINNVRQRSTIWPGNYCLYTASKSRSIIPYFFLHTPQLAYSYLYEVLNFNYKSASNTDHYLTKATHYRQFGLPVIQQKQKYTGFEKVKDYFDKHYNHLITPTVKMNFRLNHSRRVYDLLLRYPYERKYGTPPFTFKFNKVISN